MTNKDKKEIERMLRELPITTYEEILRVIGFSKEDETLLNLRYRDSLGFKATRECIADELGLSLSTLDRHINSICQRIKKYSPILP